MPRTRLALFGLCLLSVLLAFAPQARAISSDQVLSAITGVQGGGYLDSGEAAQLLISGPIDYQGEGYWLVYSYVNSQPGTRNVIFAVSDNTGQIINDPTILNTLFTFVYQNDLMTQLSTKSEALADFSNFLNNAQTTEQATDNDYYQLVHEQIAEQYPQIDFSSIGSAFTTLGTAQQNALSQISGNQAILEQYNSYPNTNDFNSYYTQFNLTLASLQALNSAVNAYHNALFEETQLVSNSATLNYSDKEDITTVLEQLEDVGDYSDFLSTVLTPSQTDYNTLSVQIPNEVNESVQSSIFRIARKDAENAFTSTVSSQMQSALSAASLAGYKTCNVDYSDLQNQWNYINGLMLNPANATPAALETIPSHVATAESDMTTIQSDLTSCQQASTQQTQQAPQSNNGWVTNVLIVLLVAALAYIGYGKWKKMQEEKEE